MTSERILRQELGHITCKTSSEDVADRYASTGTCHKQTKQKSLGDLSGESLRTHGPINGETASMVKPRFGLIRWRRTPSRVPKSGDFFTRFDSGDSIWPLEVASRPRTRPWLPWRASWPFCSIASGPRKSRISRSMEKLLEG